MVLARGFVIDDGAPGGALDNRNLQCGAMPQAYFRPLRDIRPSKALSRMPLWRNW